MENKKREKDMRREVTTEEQKERFGKVITYLKDNGHPIKEIAGTVGEDSEYISKLCSGAIKNIPLTVIETLHSEYGINPEYILSGSASMLDVLEIKYTNFEKFVDKWDLVDHEGKAYLHFTMDERFYNFLLDVYNQKESMEGEEQTAIMTEALLKVTEVLKKKHSGLPKPMEYVLIPLDDYMEILREYEPKRKSLSELVDFSELR